jgi:hypothetical protein
MNTLKPYIGITGFTREYEVGYLSGVVSRNKKSNSSRLLHVGVMMSRKTLTMERSRFTKVFAEKDHLMHIFGNEEGFRYQNTYHCLHYADYRDETTVEELRKAIDYCGPNLDAVQLDMTWPVPVLLERIKRELAGRNLEFILQVGTEAAARVENRPEIITRLISNYGTIIDRVLIDMSMGNGLPMDSSFLINLIEAIEEEAPDLGIVVAGGLGPGKTHLLGRLAQRPGISIDAQADLTVGGTITDPLSLNRARKYLEEFMPILD